MRSDLDPVPESVPGPASRTEGQVPGLQTASLENLWATELEAAIEAVETDLDPKEWMVSGRPSKDYPKGQDWSWWLDHGPGMLQRYVEWRFQEPPEWRIWTAPDGRPGVEMHFRVPWGDTYLEGFIDRVFHHPFREGDLIVVDLKSGSFQSNLRQLGRYAGALELTYGVRPAFGGYYMARTGACIIHPLDKPALSVESLTEVSRRIGESFRQELFVANPGSLCKSCSVQGFCTEKEAA